MSVIVFFLLFVVNMLVCSMYVVRQTRVELSFAWLHSAGSTPKCVDINPPRKIYFKNAV
jgi:hypothetical protein